MSSGALFSPWHQPEGPGSANTAQPGLIQDSLIVGGEPTLVECQVNKDKAGALSLVRSTLVCGKTLLSLPSTTPGDQQPLFKIVTWDALLSRSATRSGGELLAVAENPNQLRFHSVNSLFAGWQALLRNNTTTLLATNLYAWHAQWHRSEGEVALRRLADRTVPGSGGCAGQQVPHSGIA